ncbi:GNAT family N-acetyltransferase [Acidocella sp.]|uniref:GNAT family N-acetyltransferase n=1 Tax=Acidocella sp. TaxID=50710 RepID=UPI00260EB69E|nr:GNAT family N-acetyltransferase [Acidocella sp.]
MRLRPAQAGEGQVLFDITKAATEAKAGAFYRPEQVRGWMAGCDARAYEAAIAGGGVRVAAHEGAVLGFVEAVPGLIRRLYVRPEAMGQGLGRLLLEAGCQMAGPGVVRLEATLHAAGFYARCGFVETGRALFGEPPARVPVEVVLMRREGAKPG